MDKIDKKEKRKVIKEKVDTSHSRIKDYEADLLYEAITDESLKDKEVKKKWQHTGWSSEGKYTRYESEKYTIRNDDQGFRIEKKSGYCDDDGQAGSYEEVFTGARQIIELLIMMFGKGK